ncbi:MAG: hypothetical protein QM528_02945 [Phycisphaerales bacterium]|nr:hypothetical protein [Phycisphaerales bacterium]
MKNRLSLLQISFFVCALSAFFFIGCKKTTTPLDNILRYGINLVSPANGATNQPVQPIFTWINENPNITRYAIYYGTNPNSLVKDVYNYRGNANLSDSIRLSPDGGTTSPYLSYATKYYWKVVGMNANGTVLDSFTNNFTVRNPINMNTPREALGLAVYNGKIYAAGGTNDGDNGLNSVEVFNGTTWANAQPMNIATIGVRLATFNNNLYAVAGFNSTGIGYALDSVQYFNGSTWTTSEQILDTPRSSFGLVNYNGQLYAIAGYDNNRALNSVEVFNGTTWTLSPASLNTARNSLGVGVYNNQIYAVGGGSSGSVTIFNTVEYFNGTSWVNAPQKLNIGRERLAVAAYDNKLYAFGGYDTNYNYQNSIEIFDGTNWSFGTPMPTPRASLAAAVYNNMVYLVGGDTTDASGNPAPLSTVEIYNPATNQWQ